jgi:hypothetical protein
LLIDDLPRKAYIAQQGRKISGCLWEFSGFLNGEFIECD